MWRMLIFPALLALSACADESISGYADPQAVYRLVELSGVSFEARATIGFPEKGRIAGQAPCNSYSGSQTAPYPWFSPGPIAATRRACADLGAEGAYFKALQSARLAEVSGDVLILSNEDGLEMLFRAE